MKKLKTAFAVVGILLVAAIAALWVLRYFDDRQTWPGRQLKNAVTLGRMLWPYHEAHGRYPERLSDLVADGTFRADEFESLRFRSSRYAAPEDWLYRIPYQIDDVAIESPRSIGDDFIVIARADGGGEVAQNGPGYKLYRDQHHKQPRANKAP